MQIENPILSQKFTNTSFKALRISPKALEEIDYMGGVVKKIYEEKWYKMSQYIQDSKFYDVVINEKLRPIFVEKATGIELRNVRLRSRNLGSILISADIKDNGKSITNSYITLPNNDFFNFITTENKLIENCNDIVKITKVLEAYKERV